MSKKATKKSEPRKTSTRARRSRAAEAASPAETPNEIAVAEAAPSLEQIRDRAYQIFRTGANPRDPVADWFQAERELKGDARV
jgi:hypothetical protein